jgi:hypothetical protein
MADMITFVDAFTESQMGYHEYMCEMIQESCEEEDKETCYTNAGMDCEDQRGKDQFNIQKYLECNVAQIGGIGHIPF